MSTFAHLLLHEVVVPSSYGPFQIGNGNDAKRRHFLFHLDRTCISPWVSVNSLPSPYFLINLSHPPSDLSSFIPKADFHFLRLYTQQTSSSHPVVYTTVVFIKFHFHLCLVAYSILFVINLGCTLTMAPLKVKSRANKSAARLRNSQPQTELQVPTTSETIVTLDQSFDLLRIAVVAAVSTTLISVLNQRWLTRSQISQITWARYITLVNLESDNLLIILGVCFQMTVMKFASLIPMTITHRMRTSCRGRQLGMRVNIGLGGFLTGALIRVLIKSWTGLWVLLESSLNTLSNVY